MSVESWSAQQLAEFLAAVGSTNDERAALKRRVSELLGSAIVEEKSYAR